MRTIAEPTSMFRAAQLVGEAVQLANATVGKALASIKISGASSILLGGRIGDAPPALFLIYSAGNFIECKPDMPFFQIGETKYGRPMLDRTIKPATPLAEAMKIAFLSFDASIRSNLAVARPLDLMVMPARAGRAGPDPADRATTIPISTISRRAGAICSTTPPRPSPIRPSWRTSTDERRVRGAARPRPRLSRRRSRISPGATPRSRCAARPSSGSTRATARSASPSSCRSAATSPRCSISPRPPATGSAARAGSAAASAPARRPISTC